VETSKGFCDHGQNGFFMVKFDQADNKEKSYLMALG